MNNRERIKSTFAFKKPDDRLPMVEWAVWWDKTIDRWHQEGLPKDIPNEEIGEYLGLDKLRQFWIGPKTKAFRDHIKENGYIKGQKTYESVKHMLYPKDVVELRKEKILSFKEEHDKGDMVIWMSLEGFFWFPRTLFGIEDHLFAFYDEPELMHQMNQDLTDYNIHVVEEFCKLVKPEFMTFAEDMSYNLGPMLSYEMFEEFLLPYYKQIIPVLNKYDITPIVDTDGQLESMIPWLKEAGLEGALPLERQAGVDVNRLRKEHPDFKILGAFDKMVMDKGEKAMRQEFERILPVMKGGGFIPSVDHQTPPAVSFEDYKLYLKLLKEYCEKAVE